MLKYYTRHKFIFAAGLAAFIHSTWSFAVIMSGALPTLPTYGESWTHFAEFGLTLVYKLLPAALMAYAIDVGQIEAAEKIREGNNSYTNLFAFTITALFTFYLQFLFMIHHMPSLVVSPGAAPAAATFGVHVRDAAIWVMPALLPLSLIIRMTSDAEAQPRPKILDGDYTEAPETSESLELQVRGGSMLAIDQKSLQDAFPAACPYCEWEDEYLTSKDATFALNQHVLASHSTTVEKSNGHH